MCASNVRPAHSPHPNRFFPRTTARIYLIVGNARGSVDQKYTCPDDQPGIKKFRDAALVLSWRRHDARMILSRGSNLPSEGSRMHVCDVLESGEMTSVFGIGVFGQEWEYITRGHTWWVYTIFFAQDVRTVCFACGCGCYRARCTYCARGSFPERFQE